MKPLVLSVFAMGLGLAAAMAQSPTTVAPPAAAPATTEAAAAPQPEPSSTTTADNTRYVNNPKVIAGCQARLTEWNNKPCDIIFIGDSITEGWVFAGKSIWDEKYAPRKALDFGVSGDKTQNVIWRLNNMEVQSLKPKVAVIMIGTNNTANTPHEIADGVQAVVANTQSIFPGVKIILVSITPNERAHDKMMQADSLIKNFADNSTTYYLDLVPLMPAITTTGPGGQADTNYKGLSKDRLHPDIDGYKIWADAMEPLLTKLLAGK